ncbi:MAG: DrmB family protein [Brevundimonas sp.]
MPRNALGDLRRSAAAAGFGPGALIDFRAGDAPVSAVAGGLEVWDFSFPPAGLLHPQTIREERLQKKLNVRGFRLPPVRDPASNRDSERAVAAIRFPEWLQCPRCEKIGPEALWDDPPGRAGRYCAACTAASPGRTPVPTIPVRFVLACERGHLDEFPWHLWVGHTPDCRNRHGFLELRSEDAGLAGLKLSCPICHQKRSMDGIFSRTTWERMADCRGRRPWLSGGNEVCGCKPRAVQRGASNLYFPVVESALSIPPWSDRLQEALGVHWDAIMNAHPEDRAMFIRMLARGDLAPVLAELSMSADDLAVELDRREAQQAAIEIDDLRCEEYRQFTGGVAAGSPDREFEVRPRAMPPALRPWFSRLVQVVRLREVRAMTGFTRIHPPGDPALAAKLSAHPLDWLPAVEVRGEGIFLELDPSALKAWESRASVQGRAAAVDARWEAEWLERYGPDLPRTRVITARQLLVHTLAHALMGQLTLDCGYSSTALRERLYVQSGEREMAGLLIFTATTDDDGTLGGLQRQGDPDRIARTLEAAVRSQAWCSSDPLCIEDMMSPEDGMTLAACHACVLAPETSCEEFNRFLDRALLVGSPSQPDLGFFSALLSGVSA